MHQLLRATTLIVLSFALPPAAAQPVDETPAAASEWGFRPADGAVVARTPPPFSWRPQKNAVRYILQVARDPAFGDIVYDTEQIEFNVHCPPVAFEPGEWYWRFSFATAAGPAATWSRTRRFVVPADAVRFPVPARAELLMHLPAGHPRLFVRPEQIPELRDRSRLELLPQLENLTGACEKLLASPPPTAEPPLYPPGTQSKSEEWREIWWGNRTYTIRVLNSAAQLGFAWLMTGRTEYGELARSLLLAAAEWDPTGATGYRYNDEAGMPFAYHFSRTYTFIFDLLTEEEREKCRAVMRIRGNEMFRHLCPNHLWRPYSSHSNRAWHFLGEVAIAFHGEIDEADDWLWFAVNVFACVYPVWSDDDGGWHEGLAYWGSYLQRFTWWADVMREALDLDAYRLPFFSRAGDLPLYVMPPGTRGGGFGDLCASVRPEKVRELMTTLAVQARNPYWRWYVERAGGPQVASGFVGFLHASLPVVDSVAPANLPTSRCFAGTGIAVLNTDLLDARDNVEIIFKSSPFGTQSHGYESQNSFLLYAFGERLLIRSGRRDIYGSAHHTGWMWHTKSTNCVTVSGEGQRKHTPAAAGRISAFVTTPRYDFVRGEAGDAYAENVERFTRSILFVKPDLIVIVDRLETGSPATFDWWLHAPVAPVISNQRDIRVRNDEAACRVEFLWPEGLEIDTTDRFDPPPRERVKLTEHHLTAHTTEPQTDVHFVTVLRPHRGAGEPPGLATLKPVAGGFLVTAPVAGGRVLVLLRTIDGDAIAAAGLFTTGDLIAARVDENAELLDTFEVP